MYKGFKTERAFYNCKLHGLANIIAGGGAGDFLKEEVIKIMGKRTSPPATSLDDKTFGLFYKCVFGKVFYNLNRTES